jgi:Fe-S cluster biogenesis protein NfuA
VDAHVQERTGVGGLRMPLAIKLDAPFYTEEELDALYETDPVTAMRISREQHRLAKSLAEQCVADPTAPLPGRDAIEAVLTEARRILMRDGGDLEFAELHGSVLRVRLKGACAGCPRATLDLKNVVEKMVRRRFPQISQVQNIF